MKLLKIFIRIIFPITAVFFLNLEVKIYPDAGPILNRQGWNFALSSGYGNHRGIIMESEEVVIKIYDGEKRLFKPEIFPYAVVSAEMLFRNPTDKTVEMDVGFPNVSAWNARDMIVTVDGAAAGIRDSLEVIDMSLGKKSGEQRFPWDSVPLDWKIWRMSFKPGGITRLVVEYKLSLVLLSYSRLNSSEKKFTGPNLLLSETDALMQCPSYYGLLRYFIDKSGVLDKTAAGREFLERHKWLYGVSYIFHTGSLWNKSISKAVFRVIHEKKGSSGIRGFTPWKFGEKGALLSWRDAISHRGGGIPAIRSAYDKDAYTLEFNNVKPDFELYIIYHPDITLDEEIEIFMKMMKENPEADIKNIVDYLKSLKNEIILDNPLKFKK